jgi:hypothetical protein
LIPEKIAAMSSTSQECLQQAYAALLKGDTKERDRLCDRANALLKAEQQAAAIESVLAKDFYVTSKGVAIPVKRMAKAAGVLS